MPPMVESSRTGARTPDPLSPERNRTENTPASVESSPSPESGPDKPAVTPCDPAGTKTWTSFTPGVNSTSRASSCRITRPAIEQTVEKRHRQPIVGEDLASDLGDLREDQADVEHVGERLKQLLRCLEIGRALPLERRLAGHRRQLLPYQRAGNLIGDQLHEEHVVVRVLARLVRE